MAEADAIIAGIQGIDTSLFGNGADRIRVRDALSNDLRRLQTPYDIAWDVITRSAGNAAIKTLIDLGIFKKWAEAGGDPITCTELARLTGADETLISPFTQDPVAAAGRLD